MPGGGDAGSDQRGAAVVKRPSEHLKGQVERELQAFEEQASLVQAQLSGLESEYAEFMDTWKLIDTKAQISSAAAGIFLGAVFAFLRVPNVQLVGDERWLLSVALIALVGSIACALTALELRSVTLPPRGTNFSKAFQDLYITDEFTSGSIELRGRLIRLRQDQCECWEQVNLRTRNVLTRKGAWALWSQALIALGAFAFAGLSLSELIRLIS